MAELLRILLVMTDDDDPTRMNATVWDANGTQVAATTLNPDPLVGALAPSDRGALQAAIAQATEAVRVRLATADMDVQRAESSTSEATARRDRLAMAHAVLLNVAGQPAEPTTGGGDVSETPQQDQPTPDQPAQDPGQQPTPDQPAQQPDPGTGGDQSATGQPADGGQFQGGDTTTAPGVPPDVGGIDPQTGESTGT